MGREQAFKIEKQTLVDRIATLTRELEAARNVRKNFEQTHTEINERVRQAERQANKWHLKYSQLKNEVKETKDVLKLYESLLDKLTE